MIQRYLFFQFCSLFSPISIYWEPKSFRLLESLSLNIPIFNFHYYAHVINISDAYIDVHAFHCSMNEADNGFGNRARRTANSMSVKAVGTASTDFPRSLNITQSDPSCTASLLNISDYCDGKFNYPAEGT